MTALLWLPAAGLDGNEPTHSVIGYYPAVFGFVSALLVGLAIVMVLVMRSEEPVPVGPRTLETPPQTPAVAALLTHPQEVPGEAVAATVVDLAARGALDVVDLGSGASGFRLTTRDPGSLTPYESRVLDLIRSRVDASRVAPAAELALADDTAAKTWLRRFRDEVRDEARAGGWVRARYGREVAWLGGIVLGLGLLTYIWARATVTHYPYGVSVSTLSHGRARAGLPYAAFGLGALDMAAIIHLAMSPSQRLTPAGRVLASRWHGVAAHLRDDEQFGRAPVAAVAIWHRLLAYATAFGAARSVQQILPVGPMSPTRAWSSATGRWRQVEVDYPRFWPVGWGRSPIELLQSGGALVVQSAVALVAGIFFAAITSVASGFTSAVPKPLYLFAGMVVAAIGVLMLYGLAQLAAAVYFAIAGGRKIESVVGIVVRVVPGGENRPWVWVAVDTGASNRLRAYASRIPAFVSQGDRVKLIARRADGRVVSIAPAGEPTSAAGSSSDFFAR